MKTTRLLMLCCAVLLCVWAGNTSAAVPQTVNFQGYLTDNNGVPRSGIHTMTFKILDGTNLDVLWTEMDLPVNVTAGVYNVILGYPTPFPTDLFNDNGTGTMRLLEITVNGEVMSPKIAITSNAYSIRTDKAELADTAYAANDADTVDGSHASAFATAGHDHDSTYVNEGQTDSITTAMIQDGAVTDGKISSVSGSKVSGSINGNAGTATALAADPTDCGAGYFATAIDASGNLICLNDGSGLQNVNASTVTNGVYTNAANTFTEGPQTLNAGASGQEPALIVNGGPGQLPALIVKADPNQAANLQEWQDGQGTPLASVGPNGIFSGNGSGLTNVNAATAAALAANPTDCPAGQFAIAIDASGNLGCSTDGSQLQNVTATNVALQTPLSLSEGGTGSSTAAGARQNLGAAASGDNSDITSLSGMTTPLSVGQGGTGANNSAGALSNLGAVAKTGDSMTNTLSITTGGTDALQTVVNGPGTAVTAANTGLGYAGYFSVTNTSNAASAVHATTSGNGSAITGISDAQGTGYAGNFLSMASANSMPALHVQNNHAAAPALHVQSLNKAATFEGNVSILGGLTVTGGTITGNASSATALETDPTACSSGFVTDIAANGNLTCSTSGSALTSLSANNISTGTLTIARGGTNATVLGSAGSVPYSTGTAYAFSSAGTSGQILHSGGSGAPTWGAVSLASEVSGTLPIANGGTGATSPEIALSNLGGVAINGNTGALTIGTNDSNPLTLEVNNTQAFKIESNGTSPNIIGGYNGNTVTAGAIGAVIGGGGSSSIGSNSITDNYGFVGGGAYNRAGDNAGTTSDKSYAAVVGGNGNVASGDFSFVGGGGSNTASGSMSTVPGGFQNAAAGTYSFAAGFRAKANHQGSFVWADSQVADFASTANDQFLVRAQGGVGIFTTTTTSGQTTIGGNLLVTGSITGAIKKQYAKVAIVAQSGGDYTSPVTAMSNVSSGDNWCGTPSASNPCLVKIMPGVYSIGSSSVTMQNYIDVEGSGESVTMISGTGTTVINGASNAEIRSLTVQTNNNGIVLGSGATTGAKVSNVTVINGDTTPNYGIDMNGGGVADLFNVTVNFTGMNVTSVCGIHLSSSASPRFFDIKVNMDNSYSSTNNTIGIDLWPNGSAPVVDNAVINVTAMNSPYGIRLSNSNAVIRNSTVKVTSAATGTYSAQGIGTTNTNGHSTMENVNVTCVNDSTATANCYGIYLNNSTHTIRNSVIKTEHGSYSGINYGIYVGSLVTLGLENTTVAALTNSNETVGLFNSYTIPITIDHSRISSANGYSINNNSSGVIRVGYSKLSPNSNTSGTYTCIGAYNASYAALSATCQ